MLFSEQPTIGKPTDASTDALKMIADLARENGQLQAEIAELRKKLARAEEKAAACVAAAG